MEDTSIEQKMRQLLMCSICLQKLRHPKTLTCEHSFCKRCLELIFRKNKGKLFCPTCRMMQEGIKQLSDIMNLHTGLHLKQTMELFGEVVQDEYSDDETKEYDEFQNDKTDDGKTLKDHVEIPDLKALSIKSKSSYKKDVKTYHEPDGTCCQLRESDDEYPEKGEDVEDSDDEMKKDVRDVSDIESEDEELWNKKSKKHHLKNMIFKKISKSLFKKHHILHDLEQLDYGQPFSTLRKTDNEICKEMSIKPIPSTKQTDEVEQTSLRCSFCKAEDHDVQHCKKAIELRKAERQLMYTGGLAGVSYATRMKLKSSTLSKLRTGAVGYNASKGGVSSTRGVTSKKAKPTRSSSSGRGRGRGRGGRNKKRGFMVML